MMGPHAESEMIEQGKSLRQISLSLSHHADKLVAAAVADKEKRKEDMLTMQESLLNSSSGWLSEVYLRACPYPILIPRSKLHGLRNLHKILSIAITNIVERWWTDKEAHFPERMPLEKHEEEVLRVGVPQHCYPGQYFKLNKFSG